MPSTEKRRSRRSIRRNSKVTTKHFERCETRRRVFCYLDEKSHTTILQRIAEETHPADFREFKTRHGPRDDERGLGNPSGLPLPDLWRANRGREPLGRDGWDNNHVYRNKCL